jgi:hypothetical protein
MLDRSCKELISLGELADLAFGNPYRTDLAAQRCHQNRIRIAQRHRGRVGDTELVLYIEAEDVPRFLGGNHPLMRSPLGWRLALDQERRRKTRRTAVGSEPPRPSSVPTSVCRLPEPPRSDVMTLPAVRQLIVA